MLRIYWKNKICGLIFLLAFIFCSCATDKPSEESSFLQLLKESRDRTNYTSLMDTTKASTKAVELVVDGSVLEQKGQYPAAILEFMDALKYDSSASIYYAIAKNYQKMYRLDKALEYALEAVERKHDFIFALELMSEIYSAKEEFDKAITIYNHILSLNPKNKVYYKLQLAYTYEFVDKEKAIEIYKEMLESNNDDYINKRLEALYKSMGKDEERLEILEKSFLKNSSDARRAIPIMEFYLERSNYERALDLMAKIDSTIPQERSEAFYEYFIEQMISDTSKNVDMAIPTILDKIGYRFRFNWRINLLAGFLASRANDQPATDKYFTQALKVADSIADIPIQIGTHYLFKQEYKKALSVFNEYEKEFDNDYRFPFFKGMCLTSMDSLESALRSLHQALELENENSDVFSQLGIIFDRLKNSDSSEYYYQKALDLDPKDPLVNNNYAYSLIVKGDKLDKASEMVNIALIAEPDNASYLDTYGWLQYKKGNYEIALEYILKSIEKGVDSAEVFEHLGDVYWELNRKKDAKEAWLRALEIEPDNMNIKQRLEKKD